MIDGIESTSFVPVRIGWGMGLLTLFAAIFGSLLSGSAMWLLSGSPGAGASAMLGAFVASCSRTSASFAGASGGAGGRK